MVKKTMNKSVSVIIPAFNAAKYLAEALDSALAQTYLPVEILLIDDGSTDNTAGIVKKYGDKIRYFYQENQGIGAARNTGVHLAEGDYISFLDADDYWTPDKLEKQMAVLAANPEIQLVFGWVQQFISPEISEIDRQQWHCPSEPMSGIHAGTMLLRKTDFERVGDYRTDLKNSEFLEWYGRAQALGLKHHVLPEVLMYRRIHGQNTMLSTAKDPEESLRAIRMVLEMKRKKADEAK